MLVNKASLDGLFQNLLVTFNNAFDAAPTTWEKIAMKVPSSSAYNNYKWLSNFPKMQHWIGDKSVKSLQAYKYILENNDYEATVEVDRNDIEDDQLGIYEPQAKSAGFSAKQLPDELICGSAANGVFTQLCFDGQYMVDVDHPVGNKLVSNKGTAALSCATLALAQASLGVGITAMNSFKDDEGRPLNVHPNILMVPPALRETANTLMTTDRLQDGTPNPYKGTMEVVVNLWLTSNTAWFLLDTTKPVKPFIYQERKVPMFVSQVDMNATDVFMRRKFKFGAEARAAAGYGFWQLIYGTP